MTSDVPDLRTLTSESPGTALLVATVIGSGIMAERLSGGSAVGRSPAPKPS